LAGLSTFGRATFGAHRRLFGGWDLNGFGARSDSRAALRAFCPFLAILPLALARGRSVSCKISKKNAKKREEAEKCDKIDKNFSMLLQNGKNCVIILHW